MSSTRSVPNSIPTSVRTTISTSNLTSNVPSGRQEIIDAIKAAEERLGRAPKRAEFFGRSGISKRALSGLFESWPEAVRAAGLRPQRRAKVRAAEELIADWGRVVRMLGRRPTQVEYQKSGEFSWFQWKSKFGRWAAAERVFREYSYTKPEWSDVIAILGSDAAKEADVAPVTGPASVKGCAPGSSVLMMDSARGLIEFKNEWHAWLKAETPGKAGAPAYGDPIDFRRFRHAPVNESGVVLLFGMLAAEMGLLIEAVQPGFPDCEAKYKGEDGKWRRLRIEFEYESRNFLVHGHDAAGCDVIVCWRHNWKECPVKVVELCSAVLGLKAA
ncbi:MAG: hypothetical protein JNK16_03890 [Phycisphaerales bacterium]|nr:hypothetical protein [Phycisphaerales bacterium]